VTLFAGRPGLDVRTYPIRVLLCVGLAGCAVGPDHEPPQRQVPERWSEAEPGVVTTRPAEVAEWWTTLNDPMLNALIERAVRSNINLRIANARVRQARAQRGVVAADLWPQADLSGSYNYKGTSLNEKPETSGDSSGVGGQLLDAVSDATGSAIANGSLDPSGFASDVVSDAVSGALDRNDGGGANGTVRAQNLFEVGFDATWELDIFGGVRRSVEAAEAEIDAAEEDRRDVLVTLLSEVARNYVEARGYQRQISIARENIATQQKTLDLTRIRLDGGLTSELDVAQAKAQLASTQSEVPTLETYFRQAVHRLGVLLGEHPGTLLADLSTEARIPASPPPIPVGVPSELLRRRPDIRRSERQLAAATAEIGVATADLFPKFSLTGSFGSQTHDMQHFLDRRSLFWSVGPSVSWPILDAGRIRANIEVQDAIQQEALARYELTVLTALEDVENALAAYQREHVRYRHLADAVAANRRAVILANERYVAGVADFLSVLEAERSLYATQVQLVQSTTDTTLHAITLYKALGGGWQPVASEP